MLIRITLVATIACSSVNAAGIKIPKTSGGSGSIAFPDVCDTPSTNAPAPIPYPNTGTVSSTGPKKSKTKIKLSGTGSDSSDDEDQDDEDSGDETCNPPQPTGGE